MAGAVLAAGLMLEAPKSAAAEAPAQGKIFICSYDKTKTPSVGVGLSKRVSLPLGIEVDASIALSSGGKTANLESAELDLTRPVGHVSITAYAYNDRFYYVDCGYGALLNYGSFHAGGEYIGNGWSVALAKYVVRLADGKVRLVPKVIISFSDKKVEGLGMEGRGELDVGDVTVFAKVMHLRALPGGSWMNGNMQAGMSFSF